MSTPLINQLGVVKRHIERADAAAVHRPPLRRLEKAVGARGRGGLPARVTAAVGHSSPATTAKPNAWLSATVAFRTYLRVSNSKS